MLKDITINRRPQPGVVAKIRNSYVVTLPDTRFDGDVRSILNRLRDIFLRNEYFELEKLIENLNPGEQLNVVVEELYPVGPKTTRLAVARLD